MTNEYIFFDIGLRDRFVAFLAARDIAAAVSEDEIAGYVVAVADDLDDAADAAIEAEYDALMDEQRELVDADDAEGARDLLGVNVTLADGRPCVVRLPAAIARRLFEHFAADEIHELVAAVAQSVANPVDGPLCRTA